MGKRRGTVRFFDEPVEMKSSSGSHSRSSLTVLEVAPQSIKYPLGGCWEREMERKERKRKESESRKEGVDMADMKRGREKLKESEVKV